MHKGLRVIIVAIQVQAVKIYVAAVEAFRNKERQHTTHLTTKIDGFLGFSPGWMRMYSFVVFFFNLTPNMTKLRVYLVLHFPYCRYNSILSSYFVFTLFFIVYLSPVNFLHVLFFLCSFVTFLFFSPSLCSLCLVRERLWNYVVFLVLASWYHILRNVCSWGVVLSHYELHGNISYFKCGIV